MQTVDHLQRFGLTAGVLCGTLNRREIDADIVVATLQSSAPLMGKQFDLCVLDECHKIDYNSPESLYFSLFVSQPDALKVGFTATPFRSTERIYPSFFPNPLYTKSMEWAQAHGYIVRAITKEPTDEARLIDLSKTKTVMGDWDLSQLSRDIEADTEKLKLQVQDAVKRSADRKHRLWVCISTKHADLVGSMLESMNEPVSIIHSDSDDDIDLKVLPRNIVSVMMFSEGVDIPAIDCVVMLRPTKSPTLMIQVFGRALRPAAGKDSALILDYGKVLRNCGPLDDPFIGDSLDKRTTGQKLEDRDEKVFVCSECGAICFIAIKALKVCVECGHEEKNKINDKNLLTSADQDVALYSAKKKFYRIKSIRYMPDRDRKNKRVYIATDSHTLFFSLRNPAFIRDNHKMRYAAKALEDKVERLIRDCTGIKDFSIRGIDQHEWDVSGWEVEATSEVPPPMDTSAPLFDGARITTYHNFDKLHGHRRVVVQDATQHDEELRLL